MSSTHAAWGLALLCTGVAARAQAPVLHVLPDLGGGAGYGQAFGISGRDPLVAGVSSNPNSPHAFRWRGSTGVVDLGDPGQTPFEAKAWAVDSIGSTIVGEVYLNSPPQYQAFRWTEATGMVALGDLPGGALDGKAFGVNRDGSVLVGAGSGAAGYEAFRWTQAGGMVGIGDLPGGIFSSGAADVSDDGDVVVGTAWSAAGAEAFRWTQVGGMLALPRLAGHFAHHATGVSGDGAVVVGYGVSSQTSTQAFRWDAATGTVALGYLPGPGTPRTEANGVSDDGDVIVGNNGTQASGANNVAFYWTPTTGLVELHAHLVSLGVTNSTVALLRQALAVSPDGTSITGWGYDATGKPRAWVAILERPWQIYCSAKVNSLGCEPTIAGEGFPSASNNGPFTPRVAQVRNGKAGLFFYRVNGAQAAVPFQGGTLCVGPGGVKRTPALSAGGNPPPADDCSGLYTRDFNAFAAGLGGGNPDPGLQVPGNTYQCQAWGRDPGFPTPNATTLSDALDVELAA